MPTVPWIRLYTSWPRHRKTMALRRMLGTAEPILELWCWASENAANGDLSKIGPDEIEMASGWRGKRGRCFSAMVEVGFLDTSPSGSIRLHDWMEMTGAGVESLKISQEGSRVRMALRRDASLMKVVKERDMSLCRYCGRSVDWGDRRGQDGGTYDHVDPISKGGSNSPDNVVVACRACNSQKKDRTLKESGLALLDPPGNLPVNAESNTGQEERRGEETPDPKSSSPSLEADPDRSKPCARIRPRTAHDLIHCLKVAIERAQPENGFWNPGDAFADRDARAFLEGFGESLEEALETIESRIVIFARDSAMKPWTVKRFAREYNGLGQPATNDPRRKGPEPFRWPDHPYLAGGKNGP